MKILKLTILGTPKQKQGFSFTKKGFRYTKREHKEAEENIRAQIISQLPKNFRLFDKPLEIKSIKYVFPVPKSFPEWKKKLIREGKEVYKTTKPDLSDNLQKGLFDAMESIIYLNDSSICKIGTIKKIYGFKPRTEIVIKEFEGLTDRSKK